MIRSFSASSVVSFGWAARNRARWARAAQVRDEGEARSGRRRASCPGASGATLDTAAVDDEPRIDRLPLEAAEAAAGAPHGGRATSSPTRSAPFSRLRRDERCEGRDRERGRRIAKAHLPRAVEEARRQRAARLAPVRRRQRERCARSGTPSSAGSVRRPRRSAARSTSVPGAGFEIETDAVSASMTRSAFCGCSPKRRSSRFASSAGAHRAEPVGDVDLRGAAEADMAQEPLAGARVERDVERRVEERPGTERTTRHPLLTTRADEADRARSTRACAAGSTAAAASARVIPPTSTPPIVVPAGIVLRSDSATPPRAAATSTTMAATRRRSPPRAGGDACGGRPGRREKDVRHPAETSRGSVKPV